MASGQGSRKSAGTRSNSGRSGSSRSTSSGRKKTAKKRVSAQREPLDSAIKNEVILIGVFALAVFLFLCNFGIVGVAGDIVSGIMFGLFGLTAYLAPILLFLAVAFGVSNRGNRVAVGKLVAAVLLFFLVGIVCELLSGGWKEDTFYNIKSIYLRCSEGRSGGGAIAGSLAFAGCRFLSIVGTVLAVIVLMIICLVVLTEKSFVSGVKSGGQRVYERTKEDATVRRERAQRRRAGQEELKKAREEEKRLRAEEKENERILRMDKKVSGVMLNTSLTGEEEKKPGSTVRDDIHEIVLNDFDEEELKEVQIHMAAAGGTEPEPPAEPFITAEEEQKGELFGDEPEAMPGEALPSGPHDVPHRPEARMPASGFGPASGFPGTEEKNAAGTGEQERKPQRTVPGKYVFPPLKLLKKGEQKGEGDSAKQLKETAAHLQKTLATFGVKVTITDISKGPAVTRYEMQPEQGVKVSKIVGLADDIKLNLAATDIRIEAPIPGKAAVGIEVPNKENSTVALRDLLEAREFKEFSSRLAFAVGRDIAGKTVVADIAKMPHMLIAGATGSGKSVCINTLIMSILYKAHPDEVKLIMVDPKVVELSVYNGIPHLLIPVVTDPKKAAAALHWGVAEMNDRYKKFADYNVRDLKGFNKAAETMRERGEADAPANLPQIVIIVDELADLMMVAPGEVEESICRLAQLARAAGIHLIIATQRPSVDVITGLIKANMPSRVAFAVSSGVDSRTILDMNGAEKLLGKGDMLFYPQGYPKPVRIQGAFVSDKEVSDVVDYLKNQAIGNIYSEDVEEKIKDIGVGTGAEGTAGADAGSSRDQYFVDAGRFIIEKDKASIGMLQRVFKIGFNRAARIMDQLCEAGVVGEEEGTKPRKVLMSPEQFEQLIEEQV